METVFYNTPTKEAGVAPELEVRVEASAVTLWQPSPTSELSMTLLTTVENPQEMRPKPQGRP